MEKHVFCTVQGEKKQGYLIQGVRLLVAPQKPTLASNQISHRMMWRKKCQRAVVFDINIWNQY